MYGTAAPQRVGAQCISRESVTHGQRGEWHVGADEGSTPLHLLVWRKWCTLSQCAVREQPGVSVASRVPSLRCASPEGATSKSNLIELQNNTIFKAGIENSL